MWKEIYKSNRKVIFKTDKGNEVEIYKEHIGGRYWWFVAIVTKKKLYNVYKDFTSKKDAIASAKYWINKRKL